MLSVNASHKGSRLELLGKIIFLIYYPPPPKKNQCILSLSSLCINLAALFRSLQATVAHWCQRVSGYSRKWSHLNATGFKSDVLLVQEGLRCSRTSGENKTIEDLNSASLMRWKGAEKAIKKKKKLKGMSTRSSTGRLFFCSYSCCFRTLAYRFVSPQCCRTIRHLWEDTEGFSPD